MPYCTRCGKKIAEGEKCSCQKKGIDFDAALQSKNPIKQFFGLQEVSYDPKIRYERDMQIVPENVTPDEGEIPIRQYDLCTMRSRLKFMRAEGRLQVTNKRIIYRAKGISMTGPTVVQHEFAIAELAGFQISRNFRFSILDLLLIFLLGGLCGVIGWRLAYQSFYDYSVFRGIVMYILGLAALAFTFFLDKHYASKACLAAFSLTAIAMTILGADVSRTVAIILLIPALLALIQKVASDILFSFKPNLDFEACNKVGSGNVMHIRCERAGFGASTQLFNAVFTGYNEVLPTEQTDAAIRDIGAMVSDIQKLGDLAIEKWKVG